MNVAEAIRTKRAIRLFEDRPLPDEAVNAILNAGRRAQSSKNSQPWHFIVVRKREALVALSKLGTYAGHLAGAAMSVVIVTPDPAERWSIMFDAGQSAAYMQLAAWDLGVGSCPATFYEPEQARQLLGVPPEWHVQMALSFGYPAEAPKPEAPKRAGRRSLTEVVHWENWSLTDSSTGQTVNLDR
jgi:nitroreductase